MDTRAILKVFILLFPLFLLFATYTVAPFAVQEFEDTVFHFTINLQQTLAGTSQKLPNNDTYHSLSGTITGTVDGYAGKRQNILNYTDANAPGASEAPLLILLSFTPPVGYAIGSELIPFLLGMPRPRLTPKPTGAQLSAKPKRQTQPTPTHLSRTRHIPTVRNAYVGRDGRLRVVLA
ncbi:MAG: hypothetical protein ABWK01_07895 [Infirmifilum sp.]